MSARALNSAEACVKACPETAEKYPAHIKAGGVEILFLVFSDLAGRLVQELKNLLF